MTVLIFLLSFGIFMLITNYSRLSEPSNQSKINQELKAELDALGPFKLVDKSTDKVDILSKEQTLIFAKVLWRHDIKMRNELRSEAIKERRSFYSGQNWPYYEQSHDRLLEDLVKGSK